MCNPPENDRIIPIRKKDNIFLRSFNRANVRKFKQPFVGILTGRQLI
jgi:hypothetical protein